MLNNQFIHRGCENLVRLLGQFSSDLDVQRFSYRNDSIDESTKRNSFVVGDTDLSVDK